MTEPVEQSAHALEDALRESVRTLKPAKLLSGSGLATLSDKTSVTGVDVDAEVIVQEEDGWLAPATVYVELSYGVGPDRTVIGDSFPARLHFDFDGQKATIRSLDVDLSNAPPSEAEGPPIAPA